MISFGASENKEDRSNVGVFRMSQSSPPLKEANRQSHSFIEPNSRARHILNSIEK